jgi:EAL domain-containing protein (putative c-di-GMP-specific phosphodiesterase class I)
MFEAKQSGRAIYRFYSDSMRVVTVKKVQLRERLERAIVNQEFTLYYQPLTDLTSGAIVGMEALIRWQDPEEGLVSPLHFIPIAETLGLIVPIGRWVLREACEQLARWHALGMKDLSMAVNVSTKQLRSADFHDDVRRALRDFGIEPGKLELEITESAAMEDVEGAQRTLGRLAEIGVRILIDDFGSGHSSLVRLKELPIHGLKIDRFFLKHVVDDPRDAAIVTAIVSMSHALGIDVVAEGIETREQLAALTTMKFHASVRPTCDRVQGYLFSKPVPAEDATILLRQWAPSRRFAAR